MGLGEHNLKQKKITFGGGGFLRERESLDYVGGYGLLAGTLFFLDDFL